MEAVDIPSLGITVYVSEEGLIHHQPFNSRATFLWWYHVPAARNAAMLVGEAVVVGLPDRNGNESEIPAETEAILTSTEGWGVLLQLGDDASLGGEAGIGTRHVLPLVHGDPRWFASLVKHEAYFSACAWAMVLQERWVATESRVVPYAEVLHQLQ